MRHCNGYVAFYGFQTGWERNNKKKPQAAGAGVGVAAAGAVEVAAVRTVPVGGQAGCPSVLSICSFLPNRLFVGWLSYVLLCVPLCKILYHTAGRCPLVPRLNGTMSCTVRPLCLRYLWLPPGSKRMKPQNGHVLLRCPCCPRRILYAMRHCPFVALFPQCRLEAAPVDAAHRGPPPSPSAATTTMGRHCCCCKFNRFGTRCVVV